MISDRALQAAFLPIGELVPGLIVTIGTTSAVLFTDLAATTYTIRRVRIFNSHATQTLALHSVPIGQAAAAESVTSNGALVVGPGQSESFLFRSDRRILVVGSAASTTFVAVTSDV